MTQCNLDFKGDPIAHTTVEWVSSKLSTASNITEVVSALPEDLCKELNVVRFIDCLRRRVEESNNLFQSIKRIGGKIEERGWKTCPHLSVLLFSIARNSLVSQFRENPESIKEISLYRVAEEIYDHFKEQPNSYESCSHVFKTGFQLAHFQEDESWHVSM